MTNTTQISNWGRWGRGDELGTVNLITDEARRRGLSEARSGRAVSLARPITPSPLLAGPMAPYTHETTAVQSVMQYTGTPPRAMAELLTVNTHHPEVTHLDAMGHFVTDGKVYPGVDLAQSVGLAGVRHGSASAFAQGILTRGILLDLAPGGRLEPGHAVTADDLDAAAARCGVTPQPGDALVLRGGWHLAEDRNRNQVPGLTTGAVEWLHQHDISLYAGDIGDANPALPGDPGPLHRIGLGLLGLVLIDGAAPGDLAQVCAEEKRYSFLLVIAPPRIESVTGIMVNPLAIF
ncbi:cyclase family protein [Kineosporia sp. J2-2]|uniref:Cyclase family protein n=1 Tax=Kineosporia corallincola TaxID=2835133 RepID=A0ABS5TF05_9ACTN|nr:cyclase family protein [Kineosporia corallincola]MBT0768673.1 cyclase family protein [Kineosporia corallincola]